MLAQLMIAMLGLSAVLLTQQSNDRLKRYACILGLAGQPFWFYATYTAEQWGIFTLCFFYTYAWALGAYNGWVVPRYGRQGDVADKVGAAAEPAERAAETANKAVIQSGGE